MARALAVRRDQRDQPGRGRPAHEDRHRVFRRRLERHDGPHRHGHRLPHPPLLVEVHGGGSRLLPLLHVPESLHLLDAGADPRRQPSGAVRRLGRRRSLQLSAHRFLVHRGCECRGRQESLHHEPHRGLRPPRRDGAPRSLHGLALVDRDRRRRARSSSGR